MKKLTLLLLLVPILANNNTIKTPLIKKEIQIAEISFIVSGTVYHAVENQTDDTPLITASGAKINPQNPQKFIAISWDLRDYFKFGDTVVIAGGPKDSIWVVEDLMNKRWTHKIDFLVPKHIYTKYNKLKIKKWKNY